MYYIFEGITTRYQKPAPWDTLKIAAKIIFQMMKPVSYLRLQYVFQPPALLNLSDNITKSISAHMGNFYYIM